MKQQVPFIIMFVVWFLMWVAFMVRPVKELVWIDDVDHTVRYEDKYCYVFKKQIHDRPVNVQICREYYEGEDR